MGNKMKKMESPRLILNEEINTHGSLISDLLLGADRLECMVAFAKNSSFDLIRDDLVKRLEAGLNARFAFGLDFYITEPRFLRAMLKLATTYSLKLYISNSKFTFHPKIYAFSGRKKNTVLIGSANLTGGGLKLNYEASAVIDDPDKSLTNSIIQHFDELISENEIVLATKAHIDKYERLYEINKVRQGLTNRKMKRAVEKTGFDLDTLRDILVEMKADTSKNGFESHRILRGNNVIAAANKIRHIASLKKIGTAEFSVEYEELIALFHSGGLHRGKNIIAKESNQFQDALSAIVATKELNPKNAYALLLQHFKDIPSAGVNVLTEVLLAMDRKRYVVMNQNSVSGLRLANIFNYPLNPSKNNVNPDMYSDYCESAELVRKELGLSDFVELDALFNYAYWDQGSKA